MFRWKLDRPSLYLRLFSQDHPGLAAIGFTDGDGGAYELFDNMGDLIARNALAAQNDRPQFDQLQKLFAGSDPDVSGGIQHQATPRHAAYVNLQAYDKATKALRKKFGWPGVGPDTFEQLRREVTNELRVSAG